MRVAVLSANLGGYDHHVEWVPQRAPAGVTIDIHRFTDANFPPRPKAMTSRLQCGLLKMLGWLFVPGYDAYIWVDASSALLREDSAAWFLEQLGDADLAVFRHPERRTIREEYEFMKARMARPGETYLNTRYRWEWFGPLYRGIAADTRYQDDRLFASTAFAYRLSGPVKVMMEQWWIAKSAFCLHDQLAWPYVIAKAGVVVNVIDMNYLRCPYLTHVRTGQRRRA